MPIILLIDLAIFLFLWLIIAAWMRLFEVYRFSSLIAPVVLGSVFWSVSIMFRYDSISSSKGFDLIVFKTVIAFMASISVIRLAVSRMGEVKDGVASSGYPALREILPVRLGEWILMSASLTWIISYFHVEFKEARSPDWIGYFILAVFVNLFIARQVWNLVMKILWLKRFG